MAARAQAPPQPKAAGSGRITPYRLGRSDLLPAPQLGALKSLHEDFARTLTLSLSAYLRTRMLVGEPAIDQVSFAEFSRRAARPLTTFVLRMPQQASHAFLQLSHSALFPMIEILLGGKGQSFAQIDRNITEIERCVAGPVLSTVVQTFKSAWKGLCAIEFSLEDEPAARQIITSIAAEQELLAATFELRIGQNTGALSVGMPFRIVRALLGESLSNKDEPPTDDCAKMMALIQRSQVTADVRLNGPNMLFRDLLTIEPGDVLTFDHPLSKELELEINGAAKFGGHIVAMGNRRAFQVVGKDSGQQAEAMNPAYAAAGRFNASE